MRFWEVTTRKAENRVPTPKAKNTQLTGCEIQSAKVTSAAPDFRLPTSDFRLSLRYFGLVGDGGEPLVLEFVHVVHQIAHLVLRVLVLGTPEEGVEGAYLDTDTAVHAEGVVDVEAVSYTHLRAHETDS